MMLIFVSTTKDGIRVCGKKEILQTMLKKIELTLDKDRNQNKDSPQDIEDDDAFDLEEKDLQLGNDVSPKNVTNLPCFASKTTLDGWVLSITRTIDLTEELLYPENENEKYDFVLSAKWNQDALEVMLVFQYLLSICNNNFFF